MKIALPNSNGELSDYALQGNPVAEAVLTPNSARVVFSAAHVVADPFSDGDPYGPASVDWAATMAFRRYLDGMGLGIAEAMDTAQRGMGLEWSGALELIKRTGAISVRAHLPTRPIHQSKQHVLPELLSTLSSCSSRQTSNK